MDFPSSEENTSIKANIRENIKMLEVGLMRDHVGTQFGRNSGSHNAKGVKNSMVAPTARVNV